MTAAERRELKERVDRARRRKVRELTAEQFLLEVLANGPRRAHELRAEAAQQRISAQRLRAARLKLGVAHTGKRGSRKDLWMLRASSDLGDSVATSDDERSGNG